MQPISARRPLSRSQLRADSTSLAHREVRRFREDPSLPRLCEEGDDTCEPATHIWAEAGPLVSIVFLICQKHADVPLDPEVAAVSNGRLIKI